jgi:hypothetical protein
MYKSNTQESIAIVGAGASGIFCAIECAKNGKKVTLYEQNEKIAKKILASGNGRCNISNRYIDPTSYYSSNPTFVNYALEKFGFEKFEKFVTKMGLMIETKPDGRAYPLSNEAKSVVKIFHEYALTLGVTFVTETKIEEVTPLLQKHSKVVIATGSMAASHLGGSDSAQKFATEMGHTFLPSYPSLVQLHLNAPFLKKLSGVKLDAEVTLLINAQTENSQRGDLLFTNYGVSGFAILDISHDASLALLNYQAVDISLNLLPTYNPQKLSNHIVKLSKDIPSFTLMDILAGLIPLKVVQVVLESLTISPQLQGEAIDTKIAKKVANRVLKWRLEVSDTHGFRHAEVAGGGIDTQEIDSQTMRSYKEKNLYFIGEALDVVGKRGGFNFAWAWASAFVCAQDIIKNSK